MPLFLRNRKQVLDAGEVQAHEAPLADKNLLPMHWRNQGDSICYFECKITAYYPAHMFGTGPGQIQPTPTEWQVVVCKPGSVVTLPHRYYTMNSRDGTPLKMLRVRGIDHLDPVGPVHKLDLS